MSPDLLAPVALPRHRRDAPAFQTLLGTTAAGVLASMDAAGDDVPNQAPEDALEIDAVGFAQRDVIVSIDDPFVRVGATGAAGRTVSATCTIEVAASVPQTRRGVHLSRMGQAIATSVTTTYRDLLAYARTLAEAVAASQYGFATSTIRARVPYLEDVQADASGRRKLSLEHLDVIARHVCRAGASRSDLGLRVTHLVACPCVQQTYRHALHLRHRAASDTMPDRTGPLMTHSQRCLTTVMVRGLREPRPVIEMLTRLDEVLVRTCNTLPRDAELSLVYRAHQRPQFIEDALRAAVRAVADLWPVPTSCRRVAGQARSLESIHGHDLRASMIVSR